MYSFVDAHCDTVTTAMRNNEELFSNSLNLDLKRLCEYITPVQFFAIWMEPYFYPVAMKETLKAIEFFHKEIDKNSSIISKANSYGDIIKNKSDNKISAVLSIEGGEALEGDIDILDVFYRLGVRAMTLTWNHKNAIGVGVQESDRNEGLSGFGKRVVSNMNDMGMIIDVSHLSDRGFWDVAELSKKPFIASHSNARKLCDVPRNLSDDQIKAIAYSGGVIGINFFPYFVCENGKCNIDNIIEHIAHIIKIAGDECVGIGSDFDGISVTPDGLENVSKTGELIKAIEKAFGTSTAQKIAEDNFLRVIKDVLK